jgi:hypothetical protein
MMDIGVSNEILFLIFMRKTHFQIINEIYFYNMANANECPRTLFKTLNR